MRCHPERSRAAVARRSRRTVCSVFSLKLLGPKHGQTPRPPRYIDPRWRGQVPWSGRKV